MKAIMMLEMLSQCVPQSIINRAKEKGKRGTIYSQIILQTTLMIKIKSEMIKNCLKEP